MSATCFHRHACLAATVLLLIGAPVAAVRWLEPRAGKSYRTPVGDVRTIGLTGGSFTLNTDSEVHVALRPRVSRVTLDRGEAFFEVADDAERPVVLVVDGHRIRALGTQFGVRRDDGAMRLIVTKGHVQIRQGDPSNLATFSVSAGTEARIEQDSIALRRPSKTEIDDLLSWRGGYLNYRDTALSDVAADFNRYARQRLIIDDPSVANIRIAGHFRYDDETAFLSQLQRDFSIDVESRGNDIVLGRASKGSRAAAIL
jgi:transmembrane sensor